MQPRIAVAIAADYNGRWAQQVINDANTAANGVKTASNAMGSSMRAANGNVANLAAQFNDIGVMLASGQNPLQLALQQGTQIGQVLGPLGAAGSAKALGGALLSMLSPVSLLTIATIGLGAAAVQWLMSLGDGTEAAEERLKAHRQWIDEIIRGYEGAEAAVAGYRREQEQLPRGAVESDLEKKQTEAMNAFRKSLEAVKSLRTDYLQQEIEYLAAYGESTDPALDQAKAIQQLQSALSLANPDLDGLLTSLTKIKNSTADETIAEVVNRLISLVNVARDARSGLGELGASLSGIKFPPLPEEYLKAMSSLGALGQPQQTDRDRAGAARDTGLKSSRNWADEARVIREYNEALARIDSREAEEEAVKRTREAATAGKRLAESYSGVTESLRMQHEMLGMTAIEQEKYEQVRAAGLEVGSKEAEVIQQSVQALNDRRDALEVINAMKSPAELAAEEVERLGEIWAAGELDAEQYAWAVERALAKVPDATALAVGKVGDILGSLASVMQASGEEQFGIAKGLSVAMAVLKGYEAVTSAYAAGAAVPGAGAFLGPLYAAAAAAATGAQIANIMSTTSKSTSMKGAAGGGGPAAGGVAAAQSQARSVTINLAGDNYSRGAVGGLVQRLSEELGIDGLQLVVTHKQA